MPAIPNAFLFPARDALVQLIERDWPFAGVLRMRRLARALDAHLADVAAERTKLQTAHAVLDEKGAPKVEDGRIVWRDPAEGVVAEQAYADLLAVTWEPPLVLTVADFGGLDPKAPHPAGPVRGALIFQLGDLLDDSVPAPDSKAA